MTKFSISPVRLILLSTLGSMIVLAGAFAGVWVLWQPTPLEAILPAEDTAAFFGNVTRDDLRVFTGQFPVLQSVPLYTGTLDAAVMSLSDKEQGWILSQRTSPLPSSNFRIGRQPYLISDDRIGSAIGNTIPSLRSSDVFRRLSRSTGAADARIFLSTSALEVRGMTPMVMRPLLSDAGGVFLTRENGVRRMRVFGKGTAASGMPSPASVTPAPEITVALSQPRETLETVFAGLPGNEGLVRRGQFTAKINETLGGEWSLEYDILPMFGASASLSLRTGTGGMTSFLLEGLTADAEALRRHLSALHGGFLASLAATQVTRRPFEGGFTSTIIGSDPEGRQDRSVTQNGWLVRDTRQGNGERILLSALRGREFVIANDERWMEQVLQGAPDLPLPSAGASVAGGRLSGSRLERLTADVRAMPAWAWLLADFPADGDVLWAVDGGQELTLSLTLSPQ